uniref:nitrogen fixation protein NifQ n=1 Tax=Trichloromonas sp. TaxID=3069249 RepID=UPI003D815170
TGEVGLNAGEAGTRLAVRFTLRQQDDRVKEIRFQVFGCGFTIAACAAAAELAEGRPLDAALAIDDAMVDTALKGLPEERSYCATLAVEALHAAVQSARSGSAVHSLSPTSEEDHAPRVTADNPIYRALMDTPAPAGISSEDRQLFACLLAVAAAEPYETSEALGLTRQELASLLKSHFPGVDPGLLAPRQESALQAPPEANVDVLAILFSHVPKDGSGKEIQTALWLARILAARAAHPGHLWVAMGLFERPELTAGIRRHLPSLVAANHQGMRWKRFLFKQVCDQTGGSLCKSPNCGVCSDYALCFAPD